MKYVFYLSLCFAMCNAAYAADLKLGIIGTDSSHAVEFTRILNGENEKDHVAGATVVAAYRGGDPNLDLSRSRIQKFTDVLEQQWNIPFVDSIKALCPKVDGLLLLSVSSASRQAEFTQAASCHKPIFVDKPLASTYASANALIKLAQQQHIAILSASSLRFAALEAKQKLHLSSTDITGAEVWGPGALGKDYPLDLSWYGIHSIEALYAFMGTGVTSVSRTHTETTDIMIARWKDGRVATLRLIRPDLPFGTVLFTQKNQALAIDTLSSQYAPLLRAIVQFVQSGVTPVPNQETLEVFAFMEAAQHSMQMHGVEVQLASVKMK